MISCLPNVCQVTKNTPSRYLESVFLCPGRESNPHGRFGPRDFKSLVSTISPPGPVARANIRKSCDNRIIRADSFEFEAQSRTDSGNRRKRYGFRARIRTPGNRAADPYDFLANSRTGELFRRNPYWFEAKIRTERRNYGNPYEFKPETRTDGIIRTRSRRKSAENHTKVAVSGEKRRKAQEIAEKLRFSGETAKKRRKSQESCGLLRKSRKFRIFAA